MIQESRASGRMMFCFDFWLADLFWNGHMDYLCGAVWRWSILAMHPILRIFRYQTDASLSVSGSTTPYGQGGHLSTIGICEHDEVTTLVGECAYRIMHRHGCHYQHDGQCQGLCEQMFHFFGVRYLVRITCAYIRRPEMTAMNR